MIGAVLNLIPWTAEIGERKRQAATDGLGLIWCLFGDVSRIQMNEDDYAALEALGVARPDGDEEDDELSSST